jgi:hypothetical protein
VGSFPVNQKPQDTYPRRGQERPERHYSMYEWRHDLSLTNCESLSMSVNAIYRKLELHQRILHYVELSQTVRRLLANRR